MNKLHIPDRYPRITQSCVDSKISSNDFQHIILVNMWIAMGEDLKIPYMSYFKRRIERDGLIPTIKTAVAASETLIQAPESSDYGDTWFSTIIREYVSDLESQRLMLQFLRFPKRYAPRGMMELRLSAKEQFLNTNNRIKMLQHSEAPRYVTSRVRDILHALLPKAPTPKYYLTRDMSFPTGSTFEDQTELLDKFQTVASQFPLSCGHVLPYKPVNTGCVYKNKIVFVPKNYKAMRTIAKEEVARQVFMSEGAHILDRTIDSFSGIYPAPKRMSLHDQTNNQLAAKIGSVDNGLATLDLSAASDSISCSLIRDVFPNDWVKYIYEFRSKTAVVDDKEVQLHMISTMGSRLTFPIETLLFYAIARAATDTYAEFAGDFKHFEDVLAYGDDIIVPTPAAATCIEFLTSLGFKVNTEKSFYGHENYRESCGEEYLYGYEVSSRYFPRDPLAKTPGKLLSELTALQHKFVGYERVNEYLMDVILAIKPSMTYSRIGDDTCDIWSQFDTVETRVAPERKDWVDHPSYQLAEVHMAPTTVYGKVPSYRIEAAEQVAYQLYLLYGTRYASALDELLGLPMQVDLRSFVSQGVIRWRRN